MVNLTRRPPFEKGAKPVKAPLLREASRGATCTLRIPGVCNHDPATVVGCHVSIPGFSAGMGQKNDDLFLIDGCAACHSALDSRSRWAECGLGYDDILRALMESQSRRRASGLILLKDEST